MIHIQSCKVGPGESKHVPMSEIQPLNHELWLGEGQNPIHLFFQATTPTQRIFFGIFSREPLQ